MSTIDETADVAVEPDVEPTIDDEVTHLVMVGAIAILERLRAQYGAEADAA